MLKKNYLSEFHVTILVFFVSNNDVCGMILVNGLSIRSKHSTKFSYSLENTFAFEQI